MSVGDKRVCLVMFSLYHETQTLSGLQSKCLQFPGSGDTRLLGEIQSSDHFNPVHCVLKVDTLKRGQP